jgi:histidinol-phosphatase
MLLAEGSVDLAVETVAEVWDLAAPRLIVEEAGGRFTDFTGAPTIHAGTAFAANGPLHAAALALFART